MAPRGTKRLKTPTARTSEPGAGRVGWMASMKNAWARLTRRKPAEAEPLQQARGRLGEQAARQHLKSTGMKFLTANFRSKRGEIDLIFRDQDCLVFVEVKTRSSEQWNRPAAAVDARKRRALTRVALDYLSRLGRPPIKVRFDVVEVLLHGEVVGEVRHLPNTFPFSPPHRYA